MYIYIYTSIKIIVMHVYISKYQNIESLFIERLLLCEYINGNIYMNADQVE